MITTNITIGAEYKNYKAICAALNEKIKTGKAKQLQLRDWYRYFDYHKDKQRFIIEKIYDEPQPKPPRKNAAQPKPEKVKKPKTEKIIKPKKTKVKKVSTQCSFTKYITPIIIKMLLDNDGEILVTKSSLAHQIGLTMASTIYDFDLLPDWIMKCIVKHTKQKIYCIINSVLKSMQKKDLIECWKEYIISRNGDHSVGKADIDELIIIQSIENKILQQMNRKNIYEVLSHDEIFIYNHLLDSALFKYGFSIISQKLHIILNGDIDISTYKGESMDKLKLQVNEQLQSYVLKFEEKRYKQYLYDKEVEDLLFEDLSIDINTNRNLSEDYIQDVTELIRRYIKYPK